MDVVPHLLIMVVGIIGVHSSIIVTPFGTTIIPIRLVVGMILISMGILGLLHPYI